MGLCQELMGLALVEMTAQDILAPLWSFLVSPAIIRESNISPRCFLWLVDCTTALWKPMVLYTLKTCKHTRVKETKDPKTDGLTLTEVSALQYSIHLQIRVILPNPLGRNEVCSSASTYLGQGMDNTAAPRGRAGCLPSWSISQCWRGACISNLLLPCSAQPRRAFYLFNTVRQPWDNVDVAGESRDRLGQVLKLPSAKGPAAPGCRRHTISPGGS